MTDDSIDMDPRKSELQIGIEVEYPVAPRGKDKYTAAGRKSNDLKGIVRDVGMPSGLGHPVSDPSVGLEIVAGGDGGMPLEDATQVYAGIIEHIEGEFGETYAPTSLLNVDSTAGLHLHLSDLSEAQARMLHEVSLEPWGQALFCTGIVSEEGRDDWPVFRNSRFVDTNFNAQRYSIVNHRSGGHWEWRTPEPMDPSNFDVIIRFLRLFEQDPDNAIEYGQELLNEGDERLTSVKRAEAVGMDMEATPTVIREGADEDPEDFFQRVRNTWELPEIYHIVMPDVDTDTEHFYAFDSRLNTTFQVGNVTATPHDVLYADTLEPVEESEIAEEIRRSLNARNRGSPRKTAATEVVEDAVKKKKGK